MSELGTQIDELIAARRLDEAEALCRNALESEPGIAEHECRMAAIRLRQGLADRALKHAERAITLAPTAEWPHRLRAKACILKGRHHDAILAAKIAVAIAPDEPMAHETLADAFYSCGRFAEASAAIEASLALAPHRVSSLKRRARIQLENGDLDGAFETCVRARAVDPSHRPLSRVVDEIERRRNEDGATTAPPIPSGLGLGALVGTVAATWVAGGASTAELGTQGPSLAAMPLEWIGVFAIAATATMLISRLVARHLLPGIRHAIDPVGERAALRRVRKLPAAAWQTLDSPLEEH